MLKSLIVREPVRVPIALGLNSMPIVHRPPAAKLDLQLLLLIMKSPLTEMLEVRVLLWQLLWHEMPSAGLVLNWSRRQAIARRRY